MLNVAIFSKFPDDFVRKLAPRLEGHGVHVAKIYDVTRVRRTALHSCDAVLYMHELSSHSEEARARQIALRANRPYFRLPRKEAQWASALQPLLKRFPGKLTIAQAAASILTSIEDEQPPSEYPLAPLAKTQADDDTVPAPPESAVSLVVRPVAVPADAVPVGEEGEIMRLLWEENAEMRRVNETQKAIIEELTRDLRASRACAKALPFVSAPGGMGEAIKALRTLVQVGYMPALEAMDVLLAHVQERQAS